MNSDQGSELVDASDPKRAGKFVLGRAPQFRRTPKPKMPVLGQLTQINSKPVRWQWTINGLHVELTSSQLRNYRLLQIKFIRHGSHTDPDSVCSVSWLPLTTEQWRQRVKKALATVRVIEPDHR
jgi:hypothetical protein